MDLHNPNVFFPTLLRDTLIANKSSPSLICSQLHVSEKRILRWLRAATMPSGEYAWKLSELFPDNQRALLASFLRWYQARGSFNDPYFGALTLRKMLDAVVNRWIPHDFEKLDKFLKDWIAAVDYAESYGGEKPQDLSATDEVIILPYPSIVIVEQWRTIVEEISKDSNRLYNLPWRTFEDLIARLLEGYGWRTKGMGYTNDGGVDVIALKSIAPDIPIRMMVQCKKLSEGHKVGVEFVREIWSVKWQQGFHQAMIATTSYFTKGATINAARWNLELRDHDAIVQWCKDVGKII